MSKVTDRIIHLVDDWTHAEALARTGFWGAHGGAGSIFLARTSGRLLLARRSHHTLQPGTWGTIGGAVDRGEQPEETVVREVREELGIHIDPADLRLCYVFRDTKSHFVYYNYTVLVVEEFLPVPNWEVAEHSWVEFGQWPDPLHFGMQAWLQDPHGESTLRTLVQQIALKPAGSRVPHTGKTLADQPPVVPDVCCHPLLPNELYPERRTLQAVDSLAIGLAIKRARGNRHETIHQGPQRNIFTGLSCGGLVVDSAICLRPGALEQIDWVWDIKVLKPIGLDGLG